MLAYRFVLGLALAAGLAAVVGSASLRAADEKDEKKPDQAQADKNKESDEKAKDRYQLPDGGVKELLTFIKDVQTFRPTTREEMIEHRAKMQTAIKSAAAKIQEIATEADKSLEGFNDAAGMLLLFRTSEARNASPEDQKQLIEDIKANIMANDQPSKFAIGAARQMATTFEYSGQPERAAEVCREFGPILAKNKDEAVAKAGLTMEGMARRYTLVGHPLEISGTNMDGSKFDWAQYRGKVVLVDFWATWCGPCIGELPNVKKNYELYHDRGFDVVGISLDQDRQALEKFLEKEQNPWATVHDGGWDENANASYYGVVGIPTVILVDKDGNVVSTKARGPELGKLLEKLLGPAEPAEKPAAESN